ncbi:MAG: TRAP transporter small permease [Rhodospirillales bacterium]
MAGSALDALARFTRAVNRVFTVAGGAIALFIVVLIVQDVVRRYGFNDPTIWALDLSSFLLLYLFFLALAPALQAGTHVNVDMFLGIMPPRLRTFMPVVAHAAVLVFGVVFLDKLWEATVEAFEDDALAATAMPMKLKWLYIVGPIGTAQFVLTAAVLLCLAWKARRDGAP